MLSIAIYSDIPADSAELRSIIQDFLIESKTMAKVSFFQEEDAFITVPDSYDIYIMDMDAQTNVIELGERMMSIDEGGYFIYTSSNPEEACKAAKIQAHYFVTKPFESAEIHKILTKIKKKVKEDSIIIKTPLGERRVRVNNVNYINIIKRCLCYHLKDGTMFDGQTLRSSFEKSIYPLQEHEAFLFLAPSLLINLSEIKIVDTDHLIFENDEMLYFPKKSYDIVRERWINYNKI